MFLNHFKIFQQIIENNKYKITHSNVKKRPLVKESTLIIKNADLNDNGKYECRGTTGLLDHEDQFEIKVIPRQEFTLRIDGISQDIEMYVGDSEVIKCTATTTGNTLDIMWFNSRKEVN